MSNSPNSPNRLPVLILLLAAVGIPTAAGLAFADQVTQNPGQALILGLLYEVVVLILGFVTKVWQQLENRWVKRAAEWVDAKTQEFFSGYRKRYLEHLIYEHRIFDVKGLTTQGIFALELEKVFVELSLAPQIPDQTSADPIRAVSEKLRKGRYAIWYLLKSEQMADQNFAIIGPPGSGKTTLLKHMTLTLAAGRKRRRQIKAPDKLPILLFLRDHAKAINSRGGISPGEKQEARKETMESFSLAQAIRDSTVEMGESQPPLKWFSDQLRKGRCLVMLDGLDEVADPKTRRRVVDWVERQMTRYGKNRFILTSRPHGYRSNPLSGVTTLEVLSFTPEQVRRFVHNWYLANEMKSYGEDDPGVRRAAQKGAEDLLKRVYSTPALPGLAINPLLLTMIANVHRYRNRLPGRRVELYEEICEVFLGRRKEAEGLVFDLTPAQKQRVLQPLAYHMMRQPCLGISLAGALRIITEPLAFVNPQKTGEAFLRMIENTSGLLLQKENGVYGFAHRAFQEYLAAVHIFEQKLEYDLLKRVEEDWWHETIRLYSAQTDAALIIGACLKDDPPSIPALTLAIQCKEEALEIQPTVRDQFNNLLNKGVEDENPERRRAVVEALLAQRLKDGMILVDEHKHVDKSLITHAEYQLFIDEQRVQGEYHRLDHWLEDQFPQGQGHAPVLGTRSSDAEAFCKWLTARQPGEYRLPKTGEMNDYHLKGLAVNIGYWVLSNGEFSCEIVDSRKPIITAKIAKKRFDRDLARVRARAYGQEYAHTFRLKARDDMRTYALNLDLDLSSIRSHIREIDNTLTKALGYIGDLTKDLSEARICVSDLLDRLQKDMAIARTRIYDLEREYDLDHPRVTISDGDVTERQASSEDGDVVVIVSPDLVNARTRLREVEQILSTAHDIEQIVEQVEKHLDGLKLGYAQKLAKDLDRDFDLIGIREIKDGYELARDLGDTLNRVHRQIFDSSGKLEQAPTCTSQLDNALNHADYLDKARTYANGLIKAIERVRRLANDLSLYLDRAHSLAPNFIAGMERAFTLSQALTRAFGRAHYLDLDRVFKFDPVRDIDTDLGKAHNIGAFARDLKRALDYTRIYERGQNADWRRVSDFLRWYVRLGAFALAAKLLLSQKKSSRFQIRRKQSRSSVDICLDLYVAFAILEERIEGSLLPIEGIRIIREGMH